MTRPFRHSVLALAIASLVAPLAAHADGKGRWINDGFGRSTRDSKGSTCVASGGETHAFANPDCEGGQDGTRASNATRAASESGTPKPKDAAAAPAPIIVEAQSLDAAPPERALPPPTVRDSSGRAVRDGAYRACVNDSRGSLGQDCNVSNVAAESPASAVPAVGGPATDSGAAVSDAASATNAAGAAAAAGVAASLAGEAVPLAEADDNDDDAPLGDAASTEQADDETVWLADGNGPEDDVLADRADAAPAYVAAPVVAAPDERMSDATPIVSPADQAPAEFPITRYDADTAPDPEPPRLEENPKSAGTPADSRPAPLLQRTLQMEKGALFDTNSAVLGRRTVPALDEMAAFLRKAGNYERVTVTGHTDRLGSDKLNQQLSEKRAKAVRDYLVTRGVDPTRITSSGKGRIQPVTAAGACDRLKKKALRACLAPDRRVVIEANATVTETVKPN